MPVVTIRFIGRYLIILASLLLIISATSCGESDSGSSDGKNKYNLNAKRTTPEPAKATEIPKPTTRQSQIGTFEIIDSLPHSTSAFTQGLTYYDGLLIETTGLLGQSKINIIDPKDGRVVRSEELPPYIFGEGSTIIADTLYILSYKNQVLFKYSYPELIKLTDIGYNGEGWGLTHYDGSLLMSNGTSAVTYRNRTDFYQKNQIGISRNGASLHYVNELEAVGENLYMNVWGEDYILMADIATGQVTREWNMKPLRHGQAGNHAAEVLNGIAYDPKEDLFYITGKNWNRIYLVQLK